MKLYFNKNTSTALGAGNRKSFTLIELLVVLALVAILSVVVILTLNPAELLKQARDSNRLSDLSTINTALNLFSADVTSGFMGTSTVVYVSIPDNASSTCGSLGLPTLPSGYSYNCVTTANLRNTDGTGWIPVNFQRISSNSPISQLPVDPTNTTSSGSYYIYVTGGSWKLATAPESQKYIASAVVDGGVSIGQFEVGNDLNLAPFTDRLVSWWKFDEVGGSTVVDISGWGNNATAVGTAIVAGRSGSARSFNGTVGGGRVNFNNPVLGARQMTVCVWAYKNGINQYGTLISDYYQTNNKNNFLLGYEVPNETLYFFVGDGSSGDNYIYLGGFTGSVWHQVCGVFDGVSRTISLYIDTNGTSKVVNISNIGNSQSVYSAIGSYYDTYHLNGLIDDVRIYNRALSASEVLALYNATK